MRNNFTKLIAIFIIGFYFTGCSDSGTSTTTDTDIDQTTNVLWPLKAGNTWTYKATYYADAEMKMPMTSQVVIYLIKDKQNLKGSDWYILSANGQDYTALYNKSDGVWGFVLDAQAGGNANLTTPTLMNKYTTAVNDRIIVAGDTVVTASINQTVNTPAGSFTCIKYLTSENPNVPLVDLGTYMSPGVGLVKKSYLNILQAGDIKDTLWVDFVLQSYHLN